jgi:hypothetical protein
VTCDASPTLGLHQNETIHFDGIYDGIFNYGTFLSLGNVISGSDQHSHWLPAIAPTNLCVLPIPQKPGSLFP